MLENSREKVLSHTQLLLNLTFHAHLLPIFYLRGTNRKIIIWVIFIAQLDNLLHYTIIKSFNANVQSSGTTTD